jgi:hypothetical protein
VIKPERIRLADHVESMGEMRNAYRILVGETEEKSPPGSSRRRWNV